MRVLIIGLGSIAKKHIKAIISIAPDTTIFALRSSKESENYLNVKNIYRLEEAAGLKIDFAIISNPSSEHKKSIEALIPFQIPLFIEKPVHSSLNIVDIVDVIKENNIPTYVACNLRFLDCIKFIKENMPMQKSKRLNEVNVYCGSFLPEWRPGTDYKKTYSANAELGGGVHIDLIHELDYIYWLYGKPEKVHRTLRNQSSLSIPSFDYANYVMDYEGFSANVVLNYFRRDPKRSVELVFSDDTWYVDLLKNQITCSNQIIFASEQRIQDTYQNQMEYFLDCFNRQAPTFNTINEAYNVLKICLDR